MLSMEKFKAVCDLVAQGETTTNALAAQHCDRKAFYLLLQSDPDAQFYYSTAQESNLERMADGLTNIQEEVANPLMARVVSENRRWLLARRNASKYGDKLAIQDDRSRDLTAILREAVARIPRPVCDQQQALEPQPVTIIDIFGDKPAD